MNFLITLGIITGVISLIIAIFAKLYVVVDPNEAHVVVFMGRGRKVYSSSEGKKSAYFFIPLLMKRFVLPLTNQKMEIADIHLNDTQVAPFICDVVSWLRIADPIQAAERLNLANPFGTLEQDLIPIVQAVARTGAMKQEIIEIMRDRETFANAVSSEVREVLKKWGVELVNLDINDIRDDATKGSHVVSDYENIRKATVTSESRQRVAEEDRKAVEVEEENKQMSEIAKAIAEEAAVTRHIQKDKTLGIERQNQALEIARAEELANEQKIAASRRIDVGNAEVAKEAMIERAEGEAEAVRIKGDKEADVIRLKGEATGHAIEAKGTAEATAKDKMADAMAKYNEAATVIEKIRAWTEVEKARWEAYAMVADNANISIVQSGKGADLLGFPLNAETGADIGQMLKGIGIDNVGNLKDVIAKVIKKDATDTNETPDTLK